MERLCEYFIGYWCSCDSIFMASASMGWCDDGFSRIYGFGRYLEQIRWKWNAHGRWRGVVKKRGVNGGNLMFEIMRLTIFYEGYMVICVRKRVAKYIYAMITHFYCIKLRLHGFFRTEGWGMCVNLTWFFWNCCTKFGCRWERGWDFDVGGGFCKGNRRRSIFFGNWKRRIGNQRPQIRCFQFFQFV